MTLCPHCAQLDLGNLTDSENDIQDITLQDSLLALQDSSSTCPLCRLLFTELSKHPLFRAPVSGGEESGPVVLRGGQYVDEEWNQGGVYIIRARCDGAGVKAWLGLYADEASPVHIPESVIVGRPMKPPEQRFELLKDWVRDCDMNHSQCAPLSGELPTRVLDVGAAGGGQEPVLKEMEKGQTAPYMTLSHCWGRKALIRTTKATLPSHLAQIPMSSLPKTFQDAITVTRALGIRYLWIDSLCIIQDDLHDWERESAAMGQVYSNSYLTIAASGSRDSSGGCFLPRPTHTHVRVRCSLDGGDSNSSNNNPSQVGYVYVREKPHCFHDLEHGLLQTRAWVSQERLLSPRTIYFDTDQLLWECAATRRTEDGVPADVDVDRHQGTRWDGRLHAHYPYAPAPAPALALAGSPPPPLRDFIWDWYAMVDNYSTRHLTHAEDKLPALSGIAAVMAARTGERYAAGLWARHVNTGLLWQRGAGFPWLARPAAYRAPSWSWAAYDGRVLHPTDASLNSSTNPFEPLLEDVVVEVQAQGLDPNGRVAFAALTLTARLKEVCARVDPTAPHYQAYPEQGSGQDHLWDAEEGESIGCVNYDEPYTPPGGGGGGGGGGGRGRLYCLQLTQCTHPHRVLCHCLVLEQTGGTGDAQEYRRVGLGRTGGGEVRAGWFDDARKVRIHVV